MPTRDSAPVGAPCWTDLWTSDVEGSRRFYGELFGWEAEEPDPEFGGYFLFTRNGAPVAGAMGAMGDTPANDTWKIYLCTDDMEKTIETAKREGAAIAVPGMPVGDLGIQTVFDDPTGAVLGAWQPKQFSGFTVLNEHGSPSWFELFTLDHARSVGFYRAVFGWGATVVGDTDEFRYSVMRGPNGSDDLAGIMDASGFLPDGVASHWSVYWEVADAAATVAEVTRLGGSVVHDVEDTPYGHLATCSDPAGAQFKLRTSPVL